MSKKEILLIGGGGHCKSVIDVIEQEGKYKIAGIIDKKELIGKKILNYKIIGCDDDLQKLFKKYKYALVTIGQIKSPNLRKKLFKQLKKIGYKLPIIISHLAYVSKYAKIKKATIIMHGAVVNSDARIGQNCIINTNALCEHDSVIKDNCHISTGTIINGGTEIGKNSFIGSGAITKEYIKIKKNSFIRAGSLVV